MPSGLLYKVYSSVTTLLAPLALCVSLISKRGRIRPHERLGLWDKGELPFDWWFHGASVGEVTGLIPLMRRLKDENPTVRILLTTTSPTGLLTGEKVADAGKLVPFDAPWCVRNALTKVKVPRLVITETELWPCLLTEAQRAGIECHLINGRISDYTVNWYVRLRSLFTPLLRKFASISVVSVRDKERFCHLGVDEARVTVTGNTKYDITPHTLSQEERDAYRHRLFPHSTSHTRIIILGSVRPGEEDLWFASLQEVWREGGECAVLVVPRHAERFDFFADKIKALGVPWCRWNEVETADPARKVVLVDAMGVLRVLYGVVDLAFIGATLVDVGGHNPLEAAQYGCPVCVGPYTSVVQDICDELELNGALRRVTNKESCSNLLLELLDSGATLESAGQAGKEVWKRYTGGVERTYQAITVPTGCAK
jgi:3-deoxy-D-manno-octulosonic-acid transferase